MNKRLLPGGLALRAQLPICTRASGRYVAKNALLAGPSFTKCRLSTGIFANCYVGFQLPH